MRRFQIGFVRRFFWRLQVLSALCRSSRRFGFRSPTQVFLSHWLAALRFLTATYLHLARLIRHQQFALGHRARLIRHLAFAIRHLALAVRHLAFPLRHLSFPVPHSAFRRLPHLAQRVDHLQQLPRLGRLVPPQPLELHAAIQ
ncbi:MAG: hypothetical protein JOZ15_05640, partial [Acidobacteria bacterium]|nr:hypothetical protein [Acidobacteriota bacterium]